MGLTHGAVERALERRIERLEEIVKNLSSKFQDHLGGWSVDVYTDLDVEKSKEKYQEDVK